MEKSLVCRDTAVLAKEKGFDVETIFGMNSFGNLAGKLTHNHSGSKISWDRYDKDLKIPFQSDLQKWLRDKHGIGVFVYIDITLSYVYLIHSMHPEASYVGDSIQSYYVYSTYEESLEEGLIEGLNLLPDVKRK